MNAIKRGFEFLIVFIILVAGFMVLVNKEKPAEVIPTFIPTLIFTAVPTETATAMPLPTMTNAPPVVVVVTQVIQQNTGGWNDTFFTATACENAPVYSQPAPNWELFIYKYYKGNQVEVTGTSDQWARVALPSTGQVGYTPIYFVQC
jgi:hypothetical protein